MGRKYNKKKKSKINKAWDREGTESPAWELSWPVKWTGSPAGALLSVCCRKPTSREKGRGDTLLRGRTHTEMKLFIKTVSSVDNLKPHKSFNTYTLSVSSLQLLCYSVDVSPYRISFTPYLLLILWRCWVLCKSIYAPLLFIGCLNVLYI